MMKKMRMMVTFLVNKKSKMSKTKEEEEANVGKA